MPAKKKLTLREFKAAKFALDQALDQGVSVYDRKPIAWGTLETYTPAQARYSYCKLQQFFTRPWFGPVGLAMSIRGSIWLTEAASSIRCSLSLSAVDAEGREQSLRGVSGRGEYNPQSRTGWTITWRP